MNCKQCGSELPAGATFCTNCGARQEPAQQASQEPQVNYQAPQPNQQPPQGGYQPPQGAYQGYNTQADVPHNGSVNFGQAIALFFKNYANFNGRASKSEYWWAFLFNMLLSAFIGMIPIPFLTGAIGIALMIPGISITVRRLHDVGRAGSYWFMGLIPIAGGIIILIETLKDSVGDNQWGRGPVNNQYPPQY